MARVVCTECSDRVASYIYTSYDEDGFGIEPVCDDCSTIVGAQQ